LCGNKTGAADLARFVGSLGTMHLNQPNSLTGGERDQIRDAFLDAYFLANTTVPRQNLVPAIKLYRIELELAALDSNTFDAPTARGRIRAVLGI